MAPQVNGTGTRFGKYEIRGVVGYGAASTVYEACDKLTGRRVAIKTIPFIAEDGTVIPDEVLNGFRREALALGRLAHSNIVQLVGQIETGDAIHLITEFCDGCTLDSALASGHRFSAAAAITLMTQIVGAVEHCHRHGIVHYDIKPANVMLTTDGQAKLFDFNLARFHELKSSAAKEGRDLWNPSSNLSRSGAIDLRTDGYSASYCAPEQLTGQTVDERTDIYRLGLVLYELLTGMHPFGRHHDSDLQTVTEQVLHTPIPMPSRVSTAVPSQFDPVVVRAMEKHPQARFATVDEFRDAIRAVPLLELQAAALPALNSEQISGSPAVAARKPTICLFEESDDPPLTELSDIWPTLRKVLAHQASFNESEEKIRAWQHGVIRDQAFLVPSPFGGEPALCTTSFFWANRFYYQFPGQEEFFWISARLDHAYALGTMYFPRRGVAIALRDFCDPPEMLRGFEAMRREIRKGTDAQPIVLTGYPHYMHMFWNQLPAIDHLAGMERDLDFRLAVMYEPFGPTPALFPELHCKTVFLRHDELDSLNRDHKLIVGMGAWTITRSTQKRVHRLAEFFAPEAVVTRGKFRAAWGPIFWFSVKPTQRTCLNQEHCLAWLIRGIRREYPRAGFIINGVSFPWDTKSNPNYVDAFAKSLQAAADIDVAIIDGILQRLDPDIREAVQVISSVPVAEEIVWGAAADFYFCHGGTMAPKVSWIHNVPGVIHTDTHFREDLQALPPQVENPAPCFFLPPELTQDQVPERYLAFGVERTDANYVFTDLDGVLAEILGGFRAVYGSEA